MTTQGLARHKTVSNATYKAERGNRVRKQNDRATGKTPVLDRLASYKVVQEVNASQQRPRQNTIAYLRGVGIMVVSKSSKLVTRVRFPHSAPIRPYSITESASGFYPVRCGFDSY